MVTDWEWEYNGLVFGGDRDIGVTRVEGLDPPDRREDIVDKSEDHGAFIFAPYLTYRRITFEGDISGTPGNDFADKVNDFRAAFVPQRDPQPLKLRIPGEVEKRIYCVPVKHSFPVDGNYELGLATWALQFVADDPRFYSTEEEAITLSAFSAGGVQFSVAFSVDFGGGAGGTANAENEGIFETRPVVTITGPATNPRVRHVGQDKFIQVNRTMSSTDVLVIDINARTIKMNGGSVYGDLSTDSEWWCLEPGANEIQYVASAATGSLCRLDWRHAWI